MAAGALIATRGRIQRVGRGAGQEHVDRTVQRRRSASQGFTLSSYLPTRLCQALAQGTGNTTRASSATEMVDRRRQGQVQARSGFVDGDRVLLVQGGTQGGQLTFQGSQRLFQASRLLHRCQFF
jgi:hypothetical protein